MGRSEKFFALHAEFGADGVGDGVGVALHGGFVFGFDHDAGQRLGAGVADDDAAGVLEVLFGFVDAGVRRRGWSRAGASRARAR